MRILKIYLPPGVCSYEDKWKIERRFPDAEIITRWEYGAMMWQDALAKCA